MAKDILNEAVLNIGIEFPDLGQERLDKKHSLGLVKSEGMKGLKELIGVKSARKSKRKVMPIAKKSKSAMSKSKSVPKKKKSFASQMKKVRKIMY
jgi:hypothetical protein